MYDTSIVLGMPKDKGNGTVIESYPVDAPLAAGTLGYVTSAGKLAACTSNTTVPRGIIGPMNADGVTQALIVKGTKVGVKFVYSLTIAIGEIVYQVNSGSAISNSASSATALNAKFSSTKLRAYDPITKTLLAANAYYAAYIDFPGGIN